MRFIILFCIIFLHEMSTSLSYAEIIVTSKRSPDIPKEIKKYSMRHFSSKKSSKDISQTTEDQNLAMVDKLKKPFNSKESDDTCQKISNSLNNEKYFVYDIHSQISSEGTRKLITLGKNIKKNLDKNIDIRSALANVSNNYFKEFNFFFKDIGISKWKHLIDEEFYVLHVIESVNAIFANHCNKLFDLIIPRPTRLQDTDVTKVDKVLKRAITEEKSENFKFICNRFDICRIFPAYTDRLANLLKEIVNSTDKQLISIGENLKEIVEEKKQFFNTIIDPDVATLIDTTLQSFMKDLPRLRNFINTVAHLISQRYKMYKDKDGELALKSRAIRIIIDMIDKAFGMLGEIFIDIEFDNILRDLKDVKNELGNTDLNTVLIDFITNVEEVVGFYWVPQSKNEVRILTKVIITGTSDDEAAREELLTKGSKFVRGETVTSNLDKKLSLIL